MKRVDQIFGVLLLLGSIGHTAGTILWIQPGTGMFVWSLGSSLAAALLGTLNIVRAGRPEDKTLAAITGIGTALWALVALAFGMSIGNPLDPRAASHVTISVVLVIFSAATYRRASRRNGAATAKGSGGGSAAAR